MQTSRDIQLKNLPMKVSVVVTTYNHERYIAQALESVLMQEIEFEYEIIIGEDCSTDKTRDIVLGFQEQYPGKIKLLLPERNLGHGGNVIFLQALQIARAEYVAVLDGDDYWTSPDKLQTQITFLDNHPEYSICFHNTRLQYEGEENRQSWNLHPDGRPEWRPLPDLLKEPIQSSTIVFRRNGANAVATDLLASFSIEDLNDWSIAVLAATQGKVGYIDKVLGVYRQHSGGAWSSLDMGPQLGIVIRHYERMNAHLNFRFDDVIAIEIAKRSYDAAREFEKCGDLDQARFYLEKCLTHYPKWRLAVFRAEEERILRSRDEAIAFLSEEAAQSERTLRSRDEAIAFLSEGMAQSERTIAERDKAIEWLQYKIRNELAESESNNRLLSAQLAEKTEQLDRIQSSVGWRLLSWYGRIKYRYLLPVYRLVSLSSTRTKRAEQVLRTPARTADQQPVVPSAPTQVPEFQTHYGSPSIDPRKGTGVS